MSFLLSTNILIGNLLSTYFTGGGTKFMPSRVLLTRHTSLTLYNATSSVKSTD